MGCQLSSRQSSLQNVSNLVCWVLSSSRQSGFGVTDLTCDDEMGSAASDFLRFWNGDWSRPVITHICPGCCAGPDEARANLFSSAIAIDLFQSRESSVPSLDDWGTCGEAVGRSSLGILCHDVLYQCFSIALPDWNSMLPRGDVLAPDEDADRKRMKIQKKEPHAVCFPIRFLCQCCPGNGNFAIRRH